MKAPFTDPRYAFCARPSAEGRANDATFLGLDIHKTKTHVYAYERNADDSGRGFRFPNTPDGWAKFCARQDRNARLALEVTGNTYWCYDLVSAHAVHVLLVNPSAVRRLGVKTDKSDAKTMAEQLALGLISQVWVPPMPIRGSSAGQGNHSPLEVQLDVLAVIEGI